MSVTIDTLISVIDAIQIPEESYGPGETPSSVPTAKVVTAFEDLKNLVVRNNFKAALNDETKSKILHLCEILDGLDLSKAQSRLVHRGKNLLAFISELSSVQEEDSLFVEKYESAMLKVEETKDKPKLHHHAISIRASKTCTESDINNITNKKAKILKELAKFHEELAKLDEELSVVKMRKVDDEMKVVEIHKVLASDTQEITQLAKWLSAESGKKIAVDKRIKHTKECFDKGLEDWEHIQIQVKLH